MVDRKPSTSTPTQIRRLLRPAAAVALSLLLLPQAADLLTFDGRLAAVGALASTDTCSFVIDKRR